MAADATAFAAPLTIFREAAEESEARLPSREVVDERIAGKLAVGDVGSILIEVVGDPLRVDLREIHVFALIQRGLHVPLEDLFHPRGHGRDDVRGPHVHDAHDLAHEAHRVHAGAGARPPHDDAPRLPLPDVVHRIGEHEVVGIDVDRVLLLFFDGHHPRLGDEVVVVRIEVRTVVLEALEVVLRWGCARDRGRGVGRFGRLRSVVVAAARSNRGDDDARAKGDPRSLSNAAFRRR